jgi:hypothetical protein
LEDWDTTTLSVCLLTECHPIGARTFCSECITKNSQCGFCHISENSPMPIPLSSLFGKQNTRIEEDEQKHTPDSEGEADSDHSQEETINGDVEEVGPTVSDQTVVPTKKTDRPC